MTETVGEYGVPSYEVVAVHKPKNGSNGEESETKPDNTRKNEQNKNEQESDAKSNANTVVRNTGDKKGAGIESKTKRSNATLPNTGDFSGVFLVGLIAAGALISLLGIRKHF